MRPARAIGLVLGLALPAAGGCGGNDKSPLTLGVGVSAAMEPQQEVWFTLSATDGSALVASLLPAAAGVALEVVGGDTDDVLATANLQGGYLVATFTPSAGQTLCFRLENVAGTAYAGTLTVEPAPTATIVSLTGPPMGDALLLRLQNGLGVDLATCQRSIATPNPGSGTWSFLFDAADLTYEPLTAGFTLLDSSAGPTTVIAFGSAVLPATVGIVETTSVSLAASGGMPPPTPLCPDPGILSGLVPAGTYGTTDLRN